MTKYLPLEPVTVQVDGEEYRGSYRVDYQRGLLWVNYLGQESPTNTSGHPNVEFLAQSLLDEMVRKMKKR
jgi:hypothetical protein